MMINDNIEIIANNPSKGRSVIAKSDILAGLDIIHELPIACIPYPQSTMSGLSVTSGTFKYSAAEKELKMATISSKFNGNLCMLAARYFINSLKDHKNADRFDMIRNHVDILILNNDNSIIESLKECAKIMLQLIKLSCRGVTNASLELCIDIIYKLSCNVFTIVNDFFNDCGLGVYPLAAMINHSCIPNCIQHFNEDGAITIRTIGNIKAGEEISISYIDIAMPTWLRRIQLLNSYYFHCNCDRCILDTNYDVAHSNEGYQCSMCCLLNNNNNNNNNNGSGICYVIPSDIQCDTYKMWISGDNQLTVKTNNSCCSKTLSLESKLPYELPLPYFNLLYSEITTTTVRNNTANTITNKEQYVSTIVEEDEDYDETIRFQCHLCKHIYSSRRICERIRKSLYDIEISMYNNTSTNTTMTKKHNDYLSNEIIRFHSIYNSLKNLVPPESYCMLLIRKRLKLAFEISLPVLDGVLLFPNNNNNNNNRILSNKYNVFNHGKDIQILYETNLKELTKVMRACYPGTINICSLFCSVQYIWYIASKYNLYNENSSSFYSNTFSDHINTDMRTDLYALLNLLPNILEQISIIYSKNHPFYYSMIDIYIAVKTLF